MRAHFLIVVAVVVMFVAPWVGAAELLPGATGEADAILERIRLYRERHGVGGVLDGEQMLERTRWGYARWLKAESRRVTATNLDAGWISLGPADGAGRMTALAPHPADDGTVLAGAASGGLWRTTDHGESWTPLTDGLSDLSVGAVAYAPSNPEIVYLGTGEAGLGSFFVPGIGLLRSSDGGETWFLPQPGDVVAEQFFALSVDPRDEDVVLAATEKGLLATTDGGASWDTLLAEPTLYGVTEIIRSPADPDRLWAALWCFSHCPDGLGRVMESTDGGVTWQPRTGGLPDAVLNNPLVNRIALAVAPSDDRVLYAAINTDRYTPQGPEVAIYRSTDGGASWAITGDPGPYLLFQGWYDNAITIDPADPDIVIAAGVWYVRTDDGGASWTTMDPIRDGDWMGTATLPHVDGHAFAWQHDTLWLGCDGGVWSSQDRGVTWNDRNSGLVTRQFYGLDIDPIRTERLLGGTQDNKTNLRAGADDWRWVLDGDGFASAINPLVPDLVYGTIYGTLIFRSFDGGDHWHQISPATGGDPNPFKTPLVMRSDLPWQLYTGSSRVWQSVDAGSSWQALATEVAGNGTWSNDVVRAIAVSAADHDRLVIGKGSAIYASADGGARWSVTPTSTFVNAVALAPTDGRLALAGLARTPDGGAPLLRSTDGGASWHPSATGLPPFAVQAVAVHPSDSAIAFAGTDVGLYRSDDGGIGWTAVGDGLPAASVHEVKVAEDGTRIVVATHGRGIWELTLAEPVGSAPRVSLDGPATVAIGDPAELAAEAVDPDGDTVALSWLGSDDWTPVDGGVGSGAVSSTHERVFRADGDYLVAAHAVDADGRTGFDSLVIEVREPGDDCATPRVVPGAGPFPYTVLTQTSSAGVGPEDPAVPCTSWPGDPNAGRWFSIWFEFTPAVDGRYVISTCGSEGDTALSLWTGPACGPYTAVADACNDDDRLRSCLGRDTDSYLELELAAGATVRILVGATDDDEDGDLRLTVDCLSCRPPAPATDLLIAAAARTPGAQSTLWSSSIDLVNPGPDAASATVTLLPGPGTDAATFGEQIAADSALHLDDIVGEMLGGNGAGALRLVSPTPLVAVSRTATGGGGGSYGQGIPAMPMPMVAADGDAVRLFGFADGGGFRTNLGLVNPGSTEVGLRIGVYNGETDKLAELERVLAADSWLQLNRVLADLGVAADAEVMVVRQTTKQGAFSAYLSVVDERTGDPTFLAQPAIGRVDDPLWIPAVAYTDGVGGVAWRTDVALFNPSTGDLIMTMALVGPDGVVAESTLHLPEGWSWDLLNVVRETFALDGAYALRLEPRLGLVMATSRTFADGAGGTYGQGIPGLRTSDAFADGEGAVLAGLRQDPRFRTNVGLVNTGAAAIDLELEALAADGTELDRVTLRLAGPGWRQLNQPFPPGTVAAIVTSPTAGARFLAYASVVDKKTDDPTYIAAARAER